MPQWMKMPNLASRHHLVRAANCSWVSPVAELTWSCRAFPTDGIAIAQATRKIIDWFLSFILLTLGLRRYFSLNFAPSHANSLLTGRNTGTCAGVFFGVGSTSRNRLPATEAMP